MGPTPNTNVPEMDDGPFVAIDAEWFRDIATRLCAFNTRSNSISSPHVQSCEHLYIV